jgi:hypothetical protein
VNWNLVLEKGHFFYMMRNYYRFELTKFDDGELFNACGKKMTFFLSIMNFCTRI